MQDWEQLSEPWQRLHWARARWQHGLGIKPTAKAAADSLGMEANTYSAYERAPDASKHTRLDHQSAIRFANKFKVNWVWLLLGWGTPDDLVLDAGEARLVQAIRAQPDESRESIVRAMETLLTQPMKNSAA